MNPGARRWLVSFLLALGAHAALLRVSDIWLRGSPQKIRLELADGESSLEVTLTMAGTPAPAQETALPSKPAPAPPGAVSIEEPVAEKKTEPEKVPDPAPEPVIVPKPVLTEPAPEVPAAVPPEKVVLGATVLDKVDAVDPVDRIDTPKTTALATIAEPVEGQGTGMPASGMRQAGQPGGPAPLSSIHPRYPMGARLRGEEGPVHVRVRVDGRGFPVEVAVVESSGFFALDAAALKAVQEARFVPPAQQAPPESFEAELTIRFQLKDPR